MSEFDDFKVLKLKFSSKNQSHHQVLFKPHSVRIEEGLKPRDRTLFCANIPPWATPQSLKRIFQHNGVIENVYFQSQPSVGPPDIDKSSERIFPTPPESDPYHVMSGFKFAYIVFERASGVKNAMSKMNLSKVHVASTEENPILTGTQKWNTEYNDKWVEKSLIKENIETYIAEHDKSVAESKQREEELTEPDEEGWVTVTKVDKKKANRRTDRKTEDGGVGKKNRKKKKKVVLKSFYSHQIREEKMNQVQELRKKFEQDKMKIAKMKSERKFRPF